MQIIAAEIQEAMKGCAKGRLPGLNGLSYEPNISMPDLFAGILADAYHDWQQNRRITIFICHGAVALLGKDPNKGNMIENFRFVTLFKKG